MRSSVRTQIVTAGLVAVIAACGRDAPRSAAPADSAGWRLARVADGQLELRYPDSLVRGVVDRWTPTCDPETVSVDDTLLADRLVVLGRARGTLDSVAPLLGFSSRDEWWIDPSDPSDVWTGGSRAATITTTEWQALHGEVGMKWISGDEEPPASPDERVVPRDMLQDRFVAVGPAPAGCSIVLLWWGGVREDRGAPDDTARRVLLRHLLTTAHVSGR